MKGSFIHSSVPTSMCSDSQYLIHDDSNLNPKVPAYWVVNMHTSYHVTKNVEIFGLVQNLFNQHYYSAGTFFSTADDGKPAKRGERRPISARYLGRCAQSR